VIVAKIDGTVENETGIEIEIAATGEIEESVENVEGPDRPITARHAVKAKSTPIPPVAITEQEKERTDTEAMAEETTESGTVIGATEAYPEETNGEIWRKGPGEIEICSMTVEVEEVVVAAGEIVMLSSRTERKALVRLRRRRHQHLI
jgi:hypothetical protein